MALVIGQVEEFNGEYQIIAEGEYECTVRDFKPSKNGKGFQLSYRIRKDYAQEHQNQVIFNDYVADTLGWKINQLAKFTGVATEGQQFATLADFLRLIVGKPVRVVVKHEEYNYETQARVKGLKAPMAREVAPQNTQPDFKPTMDLSDEDLPF